MQSIAQARHSPRVPHAEFEALARAYVECNYKLRPASEIVGVSYQRCQDLSRRARFQAYVRQILTEKFQHLELSADRVLQETASIAFAKVSDIFDENGDLIEPYMLPAHVAATISSLEIETRVDINPTNKRRAKHTVDTEAIANGDIEDDAVELNRVMTKKYKFHDKNTALGVLARHYKIVGGQDEGVNALAAALADRLKAARTRISQQPSAYTEPVEEATIIEAVNPTESDHEIW